MAPNKVTIDDQDQIWTRLYGDGDTYLKRHRKVENGVKVLIIRVKSVFYKGYMPNWSREQFTVSSINLQVDKTVRNSRPVYTLKDDTGEELRGKWYPEEIQQISGNDYKIKRVLKQRTAADDTRKLFDKSKIILQNIIRGLESKTWARNDGYTRMCIFNWQHLC